jgi:hypothetical protein
VCAGYVHVKQQMRRRSTYALFAVALVAVGIVSYGFGLGVGRRQASVAFAGVLASVQADLGLNHLQRLREFQGDLTRGCSKEVLAKVLFDIDIQTDLLASFYREYKGTPEVEALVKRDPSLPSQLEGFKKKYGESWSEPKCTA